VTRDDDEERVLYSLCVNRLSGLYLQMWRQQTCYITVQSCSDTVDRIFSDKFCTAIQARTDFYQPCGPVSSSDAIQTLIRLPT